MTLNLTPADEVTTRGYAIIRDVLNTAQITHLRAVLDRLISEDLAHPDPQRRHDDWMSFNGALRDDAIADIVTHPDILPHVEAILGPTCIMYACVSSSMPPNGTNYSRRVHVDSQRVIPSYPTNIGVLTALTDFTDDCPNPSNDSTHHHKRSSTATPKPSTPAPATP